MKIIKPKIIFIAANSRSGSTILDRLLAQLEGAFTVGEMRYIWKRSFLENQLCGCNLKFNECSVWNQIAKHAMVDGSFACRMSGIAQYVDRFKKIPCILNPRLRTRNFEANLKEYVEGIYRIYAGIQKTLEPEFIIDSSKSASYAMLLKQIPGIDLHFIHLVRDCRAVAFSRMNKKKRPEIHWKDEYTAVTHPYKTAVQWNTINYALGMLERNSSYSLVRYEDFMSNPNQTIMNIIADAGLTNKNISFINGSKVNLKSDHTVSGNPMRFEVGEIELRFDDRWEYGLSRKYQQVINCLSGHMLKKFHYL